MIRPVRFHGKWIVTLVGAVGGVITFAANVPVKTAASNISGWLQWAHLDRPARALAAPRIDQFATEIGVVVIAGPALYFVAWLVVNIIEAQGAKAAHARRSTMDIIEFATLREAGEWLYNESRADFRTLMRELVPRVRPEVGDYAALLVMQAVEAGVCPLYGRWGPGLRLEPVTPEEARQTGYDHTFGSDKLKPVDLSVRRADLKTVLAHYER